MNILDIILGLVLLYGLVVGFFKGLIIEIAALVGLIAGIYIALYFSDGLSIFIDSLTDWGSNICHLISFGLIFIIVIFLTNFLGKFLTKLFNMVALGLLNKLLGSIFGVLKSAFIISLLLLMMNSLEDNSINIIDKETKAQSVLYKPVSVIAPAFLPSIIEKAKEENIWFFSEEKTNEEEL
ncbi:CvpA family protein [Zunongwangia sp.]|uniref:CvpA family protein n=1 Tax=Zunongwangia sp. TaxID=1965325 RepID=UPI003AA7D1D1